MTSPETLNALYVAVNEMMVVLGANGQITNRDNVVNRVMDALYDIDGGVYDPDIVFDVQAAAKQVETEQ